MEYHVSVNGPEAGDGSPVAPFRTIASAARAARPGDVITVHEGTYRERIAPPRGGESDALRIVYQAAPGEKVSIKGSEVVKDWVRVQDDTWKVTLPNSFFGDFNPYSDLIRGDWFWPKDRQHHTGAVYLNGDWLMEASTLEEVLKPTGAAQLWYGQVDDASTTIWARFAGANPNEQLAEINVRRTVFYPEKPGINYITVRGFALRHAATPWAPPTAEQVGLVGTHWSKGWIIEDNVVSHSKCSGISLGKHGDEWDNKSADSAEGYVQTVERALKHGWSRENIGHHVVRNNTICHCEQAGVVGSLGAVFSRIIGNSIHDVHVHCLFGGCEQAGIKIHAAIDVEISGNHVYRTCRGLWLDWMAQGTRVSRNLIHDSADDDLFVEVNHGPFLVDNNLLLSRVSLNTRSQGGAYVHNLLAGQIVWNAFDDRLTPVLNPHSTEVAGLRDNPCGDDRFYNNVLAGQGDLSCYEAAKVPSWMNGNVFLKGSKPCACENDPALAPESDPQLSLAEKDGGFYLGLVPGMAWVAPRDREAVTAGLLGRASIPDQAYENPDGTPMRMDVDYFGERRNEACPVPGPFEGLGSEATSLKVW
jgi:alpha-N-arabinofuranosidase